MSIASTKFARLLLRFVYEDGAAAALSLADSLRAAARGRLNETKSGKVIIATAGNGHAVTFNTPSSTSFNPTAAAELCSDLLDRYDNAVSALIAGGTANPTDAAIYNEMMSLLEVCDEAGADFTHLRC